MAPEPVSPLGQREFPEKTRHAPYPTPPAQPSDLWSVAAATSPSSRALGWEGALGPDMDLEPDPMSEQGAPISFCAQMGKPRTEKKAAFPGHTAN